MRNNHDAFEKVYNLYFDKVFAYFSICFDNHAAQDLSQQAFLNLWKFLNRADYCEPQNWKAWIFRVAVNIKNDFLRTKYNSCKDLEYSESLDAGYSFSSETMTDSITIRQAFSKMPIQDRELLSLKSFGLTSKEIGELFKLSGSAIRSRLSTARQLFKKYLNDSGVMCDG